MHETTTTPNNRKSGRAHWRTVALGLAFLLSAFVQRVGAQSNSESDLKAMFLYNFIKYVEWPASAGPTFRIGVVGNTPVLESVRKVAEQKRVNGKAIEVVPVVPGQWPDVQLLFIAGTAPIDDAVNHFNAKPVLIVTEVNKRIPKGAMINLLNRDNKIRFELNLTEAKEINLRISSQLVNLAENVIQ